MKTEIKNAIIVGIIVIIAIGAIGAYFNSLETPSSVSTPIQPNNIQIITNDTVRPNGSTPTVKPIANTPILPHIDESHNAKAPDLVGISGYINTAPEELKNAIKNKVVLY